MNLVFRYFGVRKWEWETMQEKQTPSTRLSVDVWQKSCRN